MTPADAPALVIPPPPHNIPEVPSTETLYRIAPEHLTVIGRDTSDTESHPLWDERVHLPLNEQRVLSFMAVGVQVPLHCRRANGRIEVVDGRRRTIECREANRRLTAMGEPVLKVLVRFGPARLSEELLQTLSVELNEQRTEDPPSVKYRKALRMHAAKIPQVAIARAFGVTPKTVHNWLVSATAPADLQAAADLGMIPESAVADLARAPEPVLALDALLAEEKPTRLAAAKAATNQRRGTNGSRVPAKVIKRVLAADEGVFTDDFLRGVKFAHGELTKKEISKIMKALGE